MYTPNRLTQVIIKRYLKTKQTASSLARCVEEVGSKSRQPANYAKALDAIDEKGKAKLPVELLLKEARNVARSMFKTYIEARDLLVAAMNILGVEYENILPSMYGRNDPLNINIEGNMLSSSLPKVVIGRIVEIQQVASAILRKKSVVITGKPGVGKSSVLHGLCKLIALGRLPQLSMYIPLDTSVVYEAQMRKQELQQRPDMVPVPAGASGITKFAIISCIDGGSPALLGAMSLATNLPKIIVASDDELKEIKEKHSLLIRDAETVRILTMSKQEILQVVAVASKRLEQKYMCRITPELISYTLDIADKFYCTVAQPAKSISLLENTCARLRVVIPDGECAHSLDIHKLIEDNEWHKIKTLAEYMKKPSLYHVLSKNERMTLSKADIATTVRKIANLSERMPINAVTTDSVKILGMLEQHLQEFVHGQNDAISEVCRGIRIKSLGLGDDERPDSYLFVGHSGVGKTWMAKNIAEVLFGTQDALIYIDMSEMTEQHSISKLIGSPPGYIGYNEGGQLTDKVYNRPYCIVLLDEIEKAHPNVLNILLQILQEGRLTDSRGKEVNFKHTIVILTSNLGTRDQGSAIGFGADKDEYDADKVTEAVEHHLAPELRNRISSTVHFNPLSKDSLTRIVEYELKQRSEQTPYSIVFDKSVLPFTMKSVMESRKLSEYGAREAIRIVNKTVIDKVAKMLVDVGATTTTDFIIKIDKDEIIMEKK